MSTAVPRHASPLTTAFALLLAAMFFAFISPLRAEAASGSLGDGVTWTVAGPEDDLTLTISGTGETDTYPAEEIPFAPYKEQITHLVIGDGITYLSHSLFSYMDRITTVDIPASVTEIGTRTFTGCERLVSVTMHEGLETIGDSAFFDCQSLETVNIPKSVTEFGAPPFEWTLWQSAYLNTHDFLIVNNQLLRIAYDAEGVVTVPDGVEVIAPHAFSKYAVSITAKGDRMGLQLGNSAVVTGAILPDSVRKIDRWAFWLTKEMEFVEIPAGIEEIGWNAFCGSEIKDIYFRGTADKWETYDISNSVDFNLEDYTLHAEASVSDVRVPMYRMYNPNSGEHFYTAREAERDMLVSVGWHYEGIGWTAPMASRAPVFRLYNPNAGDHHYTTNKSERAMLLNIGWQDEGIGWYSAEDGKGAPLSGAKPLYRQYNPNAKTGTHNYTVSKAENDYLAKIGWRAEGIGWYGLA